MSDTATLEARVAALEARAEPTLVYVVLHGIRNVEVYRDQARAEARRRHFDPDDMCCPATACVFEVGLQ